MADTTILNNGAHWEGLTEELEYVKQHRRYPISRKTLPVVGVLLLLLLIATQWLLHTFTSTADNTYIQWFLLAMVLVLVVSSMARFWSMLRFVTLPTYKDAVGNSKLIAQFLKEQHINALAHPLAAHVYMVQSREIGSGKSTQKEIMIIVADNKRILINSHYANNRWYATRPRRKCGQIVKEMRIWLEANMHPTRTAAEATTR